MKNYKGLTTFFALILLVLPGISLADGTYYYGPGGLNEAPPVKTTGTYIDPSITRTYTADNSVSSPVANNNDGNILGFHIKTRAEKDKEKASQAEADARVAEQARVAHNDDGTFAYGYTNGSGAQYVSGARYVDARNGNSVLTASAGSAVVAGFIPTTFGGWILLILLIAVFVVIIKAFMEKFYSRPVHAHTIGH